MTVVGLAFVAAGLLAGCASAPTTSESMLDPQADFGAYRTFGWHAGANGSETIGRVFDRRINRHVSE